MRNEAMYARPDEFNVFTRHLRNLIRASTYVVGGVKAVNVRLRDGMIASVTYSPEEIFNAISWDKTWRLNGASHQTSDYDMMELA